MRMKRALGIGAALALSVVVAVVAVIGVASAGAQARPNHANAGVPRYQHIFYIMMENHGYNEIVGNPDAPQINALANAYGLATESFGVTHPSEPNYVAAIGGNFFGIQDDGPYTGHTINAPSLASQLEAAGLTWKSYQQSLPSVGYTGTRWPLSGPTLYASKHNPFLNFASIQSNPAELANIVPDTQMAADLAAGAAPNFAFIAPDQCHDMHGTTTCTDDAALIAAGDAYVAATVQAITGSRLWARGNNAIVVTWDENDFSLDTPNGCCDAATPTQGGGGGHIPTIVITNNGPRGLQDATPFNHYTLLATIQGAFRLGCLEFTCDTANVPVMSRLFGADD